MKINDERFDIFFETKIEIYVVEYILFTYS
jgi:hypothetical protein